MRSSTIFTSALQAGMFIAAADAAALRGYENPAMGGAALKDEKYRDSSISESTGHYKAASATTSSSTLYDDSSLLQLLSLRDADIAPATITTRSSVAAATFTAQWQKPADTFTAQWQKPASTFTAQWQKPASTFTAQWQKPASTFTAQWQEWSVSASGDLSSKKPEFASATKTTSVVIPVNTYTSKSPYLSAGITTSVTAHHTTFSTVVAYTHSKETGHSAGFAKESTRAVHEYNKSTGTTAVEAAHHTPEAEAAKPVVGEEEWQDWSEEDEHSSKPVATTTKTHHFSTTSPIAPHQTTQKENFVDDEEEWQTWSEEEDHEYKSKPAPTITTKVYHHTTTSTAGPRQTTQKTKSVEANGEWQNWSGEQDRENEFARTTTMSQNSRFTTSTATATASAGLGDLADALAVLDLLG